MLHTGKTRNDALEEAAVIAYNGYRGNPTSEDPVSIKIRALKKYKGFSSR